ncbi:MAG TPA: amidase family protein [Vicinamibacterales bacterium]|nr:amidase family protein [Vicinamibacterales bacterium]
MRNVWLVPIAAIAIGLAGDASRAQGRAFDLTTASIDDIQAAVAAGALTYERLVGLYLARIEAYDKNGPRLNAVLAINPRALDTARALDEERRTKGLRSPLHGIPIAVKDNIDVRDLPSTGGSLAFAGTSPARDATVITRLRDAGAIILMKTNMDELALGAQGLSSFGGQILNPYDLRRNPGGSSGGTGVAVNVAFAAAGLATETGVSIRSPAANNALAAIAPTQGLVSRAGVIPISFTQDRVGVHARSVADAAVLLTYIRGFDPEDLATWDSLGRADGPSYQDAVGGTLAGLRIGVLRDLFRTGAEFDEGNRIIEQQIAFMRDRGATITEDLTTGLDLVALMPRLRLNDFELRFAFDAYLHRRGPSSPVQSFAGLVASGKFLASLQARFARVMTVESLDVDREYRARLERRRMIRQALIDVMDRHSVDALVYPMKSLPAPPIGTADAGPRDNAISAVTGLPAIVVPAGVGREGLPFAVEILGRPFSEAALIRFADAYERFSRRRVAPAEGPPLPGDRFSY